MAEPVIGESITDIDSEEPDETEIDLTGGLYRGRDGLTWEGGTAELEMRLTRRLGASLEIGLVGATDKGLRGAIDAGLSYVVLHDFRRDFHLQLELRTLVFDTEITAPRRVVMPDERAPPFAFGLRGAYRRGCLTARFGFGPSIAGRGGTVPLWADAATFLEWGGHARGPHRGQTSFVGFEM
jgi:hypothetical protein